MDFFIARQPIFNARRKLFAYELLYRGYPDANFTGVSGERATTSLLSSVFLTEGVNVISGTRPCFINFTEKLLVKRLPLSFPKSHIVVEILEHVRPSWELVEACRCIKEQGYTIALDDFTYDISYEPLIELADIIKIDFQMSSMNEILKTLYTLRHHNVKLLAEKVETIEEFTKASKMGFTYFQGYFFSKPETIKIKELAAGKINMIRLLAEVSGKKTTMERLQKIISDDIAFSYKLLRFLNSSYFYHVHKIRSIKHALVYLGEIELRRFIILVIVSELASDKPDELIRMALLRAKFLELLALESKYAQDSSELFMMGLFSLIDAMLDCTMDMVMEKIPLTDEVKEALVHHTGQYAPFLDIIKHYERQQKKLPLEAFDQLGVDINILPNIYLQSLKYANAFT